MSDKFQLLLKQIRFPEDHDAFKEIKDGSIETVKLFKSNRQWFFVFLFLVFCLMSLLLFLIVYFTLLLIL
ncbi:MAG: PolC-type DNA polymerase III N-terminal domain-containing protein [Streptococcus sp.]|nr:DNA polymerase III alpha subunit [Streptococcus sp. HSISS1]